MSLHLGEPSILGIGQGSPNEQVVQRVLLQVHFVADDVHPEAKVYGHDQDVQAQGDASAEGRSMEHVEIVAWNLDVKRDDRKPSKRTACCHESADVKHLVKMSALIRWVWQSSM